MKPEVTRFAMERGLGLGVLFAANFIVSTMSAIAFISWGLEVVILWITYKNGVRCREEIMEGERSFGAGWWFTIQLFLYSAMVAGMCRFVYLQWLNPGALVAMGETMSQTFEQMRVAGVAMQETEALMKELLQPINMALYSMVSDMIWGVVIGLVMGLVLRKKN